jgi:hypothetical protein
MLKRRMVWAYQYETETMDERGRAVKGTTLELEPNDTKPIRTAWYFAKEINGQDYGRSN